MTTLTQTSTRLHYIHEELLYDKSILFFLDGTTMLLNKTYYDAQIVLYSTNGWSKTREL